MSDNKDIQILLAEDDAGHAMLIQMNLEEVGYSDQVVHKGDGKSALDYVQSFVEEQTTEGIMILLDLNMPVMDGYQVLEKLKSDPKTRNIPIIILTSSDDQVDIDRCYELGCSMFLRKPVDYNDFAYAVQNLGQFLSVIMLPENQTDD